VRPLDRAARRSQPGGAPRHAASRPFLTAQDPQGRANALSGKRLKEEGSMSAFRQLLKTQRWDDHRYYHHSLVNQSLHLLSATSFVVAYAMLLWDPAIAALLAWTVAMTSRQAGHFFFEPRGYDEVNQATHEYKEAIKVGYNLRRKVVLMA